MANLNIPGAGGGTSLSKASGAEVNTGTDDAKYVTPKAIADSNVAFLSDIPEQAATIHAATGKTIPVDADELGIVDSAASNVLKKLTWANLKATLKTYLDTLYGPKWTLVSNQSVGTGNTCDIPGIPTTARMIKLFFNGVSVGASGAAAFTVQLIVSGSAVASGYNSQIHTNSTVVAVTSGFPFFHNSTIASEAIVGSMHIFCYNDTTHEYMADCMTFTNVRNCDSEGQLTASAQTTGIRLQAPGATNFDAGTVSVWYM